MQVLNNEVRHPGVTLPDVRVTAIIRSPSDLADSGAPSDVTFAGTGSLFLTAAFYHRFAGSVAQHGGDLLPPGPRPGWAARLPGRGEPPDRGPGPVRAGQ